MATAPSKDKQIKRIEKQIKKHSSNPEMVKRFKNKITVLSTKK